MSAPSDDVVNAVVVRSNSQCRLFGAPWQTLDDRWRDYGTIELNIDYTYRPLWAKRVTYDKLVASGADVVILSATLNTLGGPGPFSKSEQKDLSRWLAEGHGLFATYLLLRNGMYSNRSLSPLVGVDSPISPDWLEVEPTYTILEPALTGNGESLCQQRDAREPGST